MQGKKKILHIVSSVSWRGGEQQAAYLIEELIDQVESIVLCSKGSEFEKFCIEKGIKYYSLRKKKRSIDLKYARWIKKICKEQSVDLCHIHDAHSHSYAILAATIYGNSTPLILSRRVDFPIKKNWFSSFKYNHPLIVKILCVSKMIQQITAEDIRDKSKLVTVYSGIDLEKFKKPKNILREEIKIPEQSFLVGNTSALADHKDYFTFIDVAEILIKKDPAYYFVIMGDGPMKEQIKSYAKQKNLGDNLTFTGFRDDIPEVLGDLDLFLISSKTEGLGTSILDAFACQVPVVATKAGGIPELVENNKTGLLCPVGDGKALSIAVGQLKEDISLRNKIIENANKKVQQFSKKTTAQQTLHQYNEALD